MHTQDQSAAIACLRAALDTGDGEPPRLVETHISLVFIGDSRVMKLKKAVRLPYLDFGTAERRLAMCHREMTLNRRTAPDIYRRVHRITATDAGRAELNGPGALLDGVVEMARFDEDGLLDRVAAAGRLDDRLVADLGAVVAGFHTAAAIAGRDDGAARVRRVLDINHAALDDAGDLLNDARRRQVIAATDAAFARLAPLLDARGRLGRVRHGHGDLHLRNIVLIDGRPVPFDCIEFDDDLATTDVLYDLGFLIMDLLHGGFAPQAALLLNRYLDATGGAAAGGDTAGAASDRGAGLALLPMLLAMRATIRAHVGATAARDMADADARAAAIAGAAGYLDLAARLLNPPPPRLVAVGGLSGSGKSTTAAAIAHLVGPAPGARVISSDRIRKRLCGVAPTTRLAADAYTPAMSERVYGVMAQEAAAALAAGHGVIADAVFDRSEARDAVAAVTAGVGCRFDGIWLQAPEAVLIDRVTARRGDPSDADAAVVRAQIARAAASPVTGDWHQVAADTDRATRIEAIRRHLTGT
ncbi:AAA family ATPase (plasmid) [Tistrella bauzanensis]|uniref:bifunctional aminoglycoside phosphotransferase/ATP-binding protein n=1 Tax=Tistrella TaxID=171436 RepID=UPI0031F6BD04